MANTVLETRVETREDEEISPHKNFEEENEYYGLESVPIAFEEPEKTSPGGRGLRKRTKRATNGVTVGAAKGAKMSKRKPTLDEESEEETTPDDKSEEENKSTGGESKKTRPGDKPGNSSSPGSNNPGGKDWKTLAKRAAIGAAIGAVIGAGVALVGTPTVAVKVGLTAVKILLSSL